MLGLIDKGKPEEAHPSYWAPFGDAWWSGKGRDECNDTRRPHRFVPIELRYQRPNTVMLMRATPCPVIPIFPAAALERSMTRPAT